VTIQETKHRLDHYWLPKISEINDEIPVILVGNKVDMRPSHFENDLESIITPLIMTFKQVEMGIECSAKSYLKLIDVVFCAQRAVLFPISPLQDPITKELKPDFEKALLRIFRICDKDFNGYLDDWEIGDLQSSVFNGELLPCHVNGLKEFLLQEWDSDKFTKEDSAKGINFESFKCLQTIFIKKMKLQTTWLILEHYGYNEKLRINPSFYTLGDKENDFKGVELTEITIEYLTKLFEIYANSDGLLDHDGLEEIFLTTVDGWPWEIEEIAKVHANGCIDLKTWLGLWYKAFYDNNERAYEQIIYLGFIESFENTVLTKRDRIQTLLNENYQTVLNCYVVGSNCIDRSFVTNVEVNNKERYLVVTEFDERTVSDDLFQNSKRMDNWDVLCMIYDGSGNSAKFILNVNELLPRDIAKVLIRTSDLDGVPGVTPTEEIANELKTSQYTEIEAKSIFDSKKALEMITLTAMYPSKGVDKTIVERIREEEANKSKQKIILLAFSAMAITGGLLFFGAKPSWEYIKKYLSSFGS
jgi:Ras family protein T1